MADSKKNNAGAQVDATLATPEQVAAAKANAPQQNTLNSVAPKTEDTKPEFIAQVGAQANQVAQNPSITDTSRVGEILAGVEVPEGKYISEDEVDQAMQNGYRVEQRKDANGNIVYWQSGVQRVPQEGTSGADEAHLSDEAYVWLQQAQDQWWNLEAQIQAAKAAGNTELADSLRQQQIGLQNDGQTLRYANGYLGGTDGSMYINNSLIEPGGTDNLGAYNNYDPRTDGPIESYLNSGGASGGTTGNLTWESFLNSMGTGSTGGTAGNLTWQDFLNSQGSGSSPAATLPGSSDLLEKMKGQMPNVDADALANQWKDGIPSVEQAKNSQTALLDQLKQSMIDQSTGQIDYAVAKAITELERALADAQPQFKEQQESIAKDEMQALDNSALYAEARGDKGGIGQEQYNSIMNTAAQNRLSVQQAQTKLATDTQRQIADLRAQGEFDKADALLEINQQYLSQLLSLEQWALDYGLSTAQFKVSLDQWAADYKMAVAQFTTGLDQWAANYDLSLAQYQTGVDQWNKNFAYQQYRDYVGDNQWNQSFAYQQYRDQVGDSQWQQSFNYGKEQDAIANNQWQQQFQYNQTQDALDRLTNSANLLLNAGVANLSTEQLQAIGLNAEQAGAFVSAVKQADSQDKLASAAQILINAGVGDLTEAQLEAAGFTPAQAGALVKLVNEEKQAALDAAQAELDLEWAKLNAKESSGKSETEATNALYQLAENDIPLEQATGWLVAEGFEPDEAKLIAKAYESMLGDTGELPAQVNGYNDLLAELSRIEDVGKNVNTKALLAITEAWQNKVITDEQRLQLLRQYGFEL